MKAAISYNVGGQIFEVSHDAVNQHPTTIQEKTVLEIPQSSSTAIFIDGNAERFAYVLDYLRTGRAVLPFNVPKTAFLHNLHYYGFQNINPINVDAISASAEAVAQVAKLEKQYQEDLKARDAEIEMLQLKRSCSFVAHECFRQYIKSGISGSFYLEGFFEIDINCCFSNFHVTFLNEALANYGLKYISHKRETLQSNRSAMCVTLTFGKISDEVKKEKQNRT